VLLMAFYQDRRCFDSTTCIAGPHCVTAKSGSPAIVRRLASAVRVAEIGVEHGKKQQQRGNVRHRIAACDKPLRFDVQRVDDEPKRSACSGSCKFPKS
jgi:hypothetical protein